MTQSFNPNNYIYLSELDSVRTSHEEQAKAEKALFRALVLEGKTVVLTYNQIVDSSTFLNCIRNQDCFNVFIQLFQQKRLMVNQYQPDMNFSKYIQDNYSNDTIFHSSYFSFVEQCSDAERQAIINGIHQSIQYGDSRFLDDKLPATLNDSYIQDLYQYIEFILTINSIMRKCRCYTIARESDELKDQKMDRYLSQCVELLEDTNYNKTIRQLLNVHNLKARDIKRSAYLITCNEMNLKTDMKQKIIEIIHLAYNKTLEASIPDIGVGLTIKKEELLDILEPKNTNTQTKDAVPDGSTPKPKETTMPWADGYRMIVMTAYLKQKVPCFKWSALMRLCPILDILKMLISLFYALIFTLILNVITLPVSFETNNVFLFFVIFFYSYMIDIITEHLTNRLPEWLRVSLIKQINNAYHDARHLIAKRKKFYD